MIKKQIVIAARLILGLVTLLAIVLQALHTDRLGTLYIFNYLGYFTNLANIFAAVVLIISAVYLARARKPSRQDDLIRGAAVLYMAVTGLIYATLLSGEDLGLLMPWVNVITHMVMPLALVADWLYQPPRTKLRLRDVWMWFIFPIAYLVYSLIRGAAVGWYPYPFLNPAKVDGYGGVTLYSLGIMIVFLALSWILMKAAAKLKQHV